MHNYKMQVHVLFFSYKMKNITLSGSENNYSPWYRSKGSSPGKKCLKSFGPQPFGIDFQRVQPNRFRPTTTLQFPGQTN